MDMGDVGDADTFDPASVSMFHELMASIRAAAMVPAHTRSDAESRHAVSLVAAAKAALDSLSLALVADLDHRPGAVPDAQPDVVARSYLRHRLNRTHAQARFEVECAHRLLPAADAVCGGLPLVGVALASGEISRDNADVAVRAIMRVKPEKLREPRSEDAFADLLPRSEAGAQILTGHALDAVLAAQARALDTVQLEKVARALVNAVNQEEHDGFSPHAVDRRFVHHSLDPATGMVVGRFQFDAENGAWFTAALEQFTRRDESRDEPTIEGGTTTVPPRRTPEQARADALGEICRTALGSEQAGRAAGGERPRIVITVGLDTLREAVGEDSPGHEEPNPSEGAGPGRAPAARRRPARAEQLSSAGARLLATFACDSILQRAVFAPSGAALSLGREVRTVSRAQRRMLEARDRGCVVPGCSAPARRCQAHHVTWWRHGGETDVGNLALVCASCHTQIHLGVWSLVMVDGVPWARPPAYVDPDRRLIRNTFHDSLDRVAILARSFRSPVATPESEPGGRSSWLSA